MTMIWVYIAPSLPQVRFSEAHGPDGRLSAMVFDASQRRLLTGGSDGMLRFWNANNGSVLRQFQRGPARAQGDRETTAVAFLPVSGAGALSKVC